MKKPLNYYGFAFDSCKKGYNKKFLNSDEGKKEVKKCKKHKKKLKKHLKKYGFDPSETWNLDQTIANFVLPRLQHFRDNVHGHPSNMTEDEWMEVLDKMIFSFEASVYDYADLDVEDIAKQKKKFKIIQEGFELFGMHFMNLWD